MLVNGKQVNYLILNGETFTLENIFPAYYEFPKVSHDKNYPTYDISSIDKTTGVKFERSLIVPDADFDSNPILVYAQILSVGDKYLLLKSLDSSVASPIADNGFSWVRGLPLWFKLSDLGGEMIPTTGGGYIGLLYTINYIISSTWRRCLHVS